jgi:small subunit ribosomal protein S19
MSRSSKKGPYINERLLAKVRKLKPNDRTVIKVWDRSASITPEMVGFTFGVHNGRTHTPVMIVENMVGHKLGEFSPTRKFQGHSGKMAKEQAKGAPAAGAAAAKPAGRK